MAADIITSIVESQAPWMVLCVVLVVYIVKLQNDKLSQLCSAIANLTITLANHDNQAKDISGQVEEVSKWCAEYGPKICDIKRKVERGGS